MNNCAFCNSSSLEEVLDAYSHFAWKLCGECYAWHIDPTPTNYGHLWKFKEHNSKMYILEENKTSVIVYEALEGYSFDSQPDMFITYPEKLILKNNTIKKVFDRLGKFLNFK